MSQPVEGKGTRGREDSGSPEPWVCEACVTEAQAQALARRCSVTRQWQAPLKEAARRRRAGPSHPCAWSWFPQKIAKNGKDKLRWHFRPLTSVWMRNLKKPGDNYAPLFWGAVFFIFEWDFHAATSSPVPTERFIGRQKGEPGLSKGNQVSLLRSFSGLLSANVHSGSSQQAYGTQPSSKLFDSRVLF